jgi:hypothetical protein
MALAEQIKWLRNNSGDADTPEYWGKAVEYAVNIKASGEGDRLIDFFDLLDDLSGSDKVEYTYLVEYMQVVISNEVYARLMALPDADAKYDERHDAMNVEVHGEFSKGEVMDALISKLREQQAANARELPVINVPKGQEDPVRMEEIEEGEEMADWHKERENYNRFFKKSTYDRMNPKISPYTNKPINRGDVTFYKAHLDDTMPKVESGGRRRRKTKKTRRPKRRGTSRGGRR